MTFISNHKLVQPQLILKKKVEPAEVEEKEEQNKQETTSTNNQPTIILDDSFKLKAYQVQEMTKLLQKGFTKTDIDKYKTGESSNRAVFTYFKEFIFFKINGEICKYKTKKE